MRRKQIIDWILFILFGLPAVWFLAVGLYANYQSFSTWQQIQFRAMTLFIGFIILYVFWPVKRLE